jgi:hypothetical protein
MNPYRYAAHEVRSVAVYVAQAHFLYGEYSIVLVWYVLTNFSRRLWPTLEAA